MEENGKADDNFGILGTTAKAMKSMMVLNPILTYIGNSVYKKKSLILDFF